MSGSDKSTPDAQRGGIIRVHHDTKHKYFVMSKALAEDERLSYAARGMMCYLLAKPDNWETRLDNLIASSPGGLRHVRSILHELAETGYLTRERVQMTRGRFVWVTTVYESPSAQNVPMDKPPSVQNVSMAQPQEEINAAIKDPMVRPSVRSPSMDRPPVENVPIYKVLKKPSTNGLNTNPPKTSVNTRAETAETPAEEELDREAILSKYDWMGLR